MRGVQANMIQIRITTTKFVENQLKHAEREITQSVQKAIYKSASLIQADAIRGIQRGKKTGKTYKRRGIQHTASAPGEYPASDTGRLASSIRINRGLLSADVGSDLLYAKILEPDSLTSESKLQPRPFLEPSYQKNKEKINAYIDKAIDEAFDL